MPKAADSPLALPAPPAKGPLTLIMVLTGAFSLLLWLTVAFQILFIVPRFEKLFMDYKMKLPLLTEWLMRDARWGAPVMMIFWTTIGILLTFSKRTRWIGLTLLIVIPLLLNLAILAGLYIPYSELIEGLSGGNKK